MALINFLKPTIGKIILFLLLTGGINGFIIGSAIIFDAVVLVGVPLGFWPKGSWYLPMGLPPPPVLGFSWLNFLLDAIFWYVVASGVVTIYQRLGQYKKWFLIALGVVVLVITSYVVFVFSKQTKSPIPINFTDFSLPPTIASHSNFVLIFRSWNGELNTLGTYKHNMIMDPPITIKMVLTDEELNRIYQKMRQINFFDYPDKFSIKVEPGATTGIVTPAQSYYFKVVYGNRIKELRWQDEILGKDKKAEALRELIQEIESIIQSKPEYKTLPPPKGGYM